MEPKDKTDKQAIDTGKKMLGILDDMSYEHYSSEQTRSKTPENGSEAKSDVILKRFGAGVLIAFAIAGALAAESYATRLPDFSKSTTTYTVEKGDGIGAAASHVKGIDQVDPRDVVEHIKEMPQNAETLEDGLQPGEVLVTPESVAR